MQGRHISMSQSWIIWSSHIDTRGWGKYFLYVQLLSGGRREAGNTTPRHILPMAWQGLTNEEMVSRLCPQPQEQDTDSHNVCNNIILIQSKYWWGGFQSIPVQWGEQRWHSRDHYKSTSPLTTTCFRRGPKADLGACSASHDINLQSPKSLLENELKWQQQVDGVVAQIKAFCSEVLQSSDHLAFVYTHLALPFIHVLHTVGTFSCPSGDDHYHRKDILCWR